MASITIRNLPEDVKESLRVRAAKNGRSMEEEVRILLSKPPSSLLASYVATPSQAQSLKSTNILLIIGGGIAAYKSLDLIRRLRERGAKVTIVMTQAAQKFITPLAAGALSGNHVFTDLFSRTDEQDIGHIRLARDHDLIIVAPATADRMAKITHGIGDDLAGAILLATKALVLLAPAMNPAMWMNVATQRNLKTLQQDGYHFIGPESGEMAEKNEAGRGRMSEPSTIVAAVEHILGVHNRPLAGKHIVVTSGPTYEPIDPVRYLANRSSGKQGHAIAAALAKLGANVTLVSGPVSIADPIGTTTIHVETAEQMKRAVDAALPADAGIFVAAVADWRTAKQAPNKIKKSSGEAPPTLQMVENPDILGSIGHAENRPKLVIGFAAETFDVEENARKKLDKKGADFIIANDVSFNPDGSSIMGGDKNKVHILSRNGIEKWPEMDKVQLAEKLAQKIATILNGKNIPS